MLLKKHPVARQDDLVMQELQDELLIYDLKIGKAFCLNKTSALVWAECDGAKTVDEISISISRKLKKSFGKEIVRVALDDLKKNDLLANGQDVDVNFGGIHRREVIKKAGITSMIALPVISSLVVPTAAMAASGAAVACVNPGGTAAGQRVRNGNFLVCTDDCSAAAIGARCCNGSATADPGNCQPGRTTCTCN